MFIIVIKDNSIIKVVEKDIWRTSGSKKDNIKEEIAKNYETNEPIKDNMIELCNERKP